MTVVAWSDEPWEEPDRAWQDGDGRYGCLSAITLVCLAAWVLVAIAVG